jgi:heterodisulfide reductase subunit C
MSRPHHTHEPKSLADFIVRDTKVNVPRCYQCGKCSAGCPVAEEMDYPPSLILRMLQTGDPELEEKVLGSLSIWLCLTCEMCIARCPMEIDIPVMMDYLRNLSLKQHKVNPKAKDIISFHRSFLTSVEKFGRLFEVGLVAEYKLRSLHLFQDLIVAPKMLLRGKLGLTPEQIEGRTQVGDIFAKTIKQGDK